jgi:hypothetical protein
LISRSNLQLFYLKVLQVQVTDNHEISAPDLRRIADARINHLLFHRCLTVLIFKVSIKALAVRNMLKKQVKDTSSYSLLEKDLRIYAGLASFAGSLWYIFKKGPYRAFLLGFTYRRWNAPITSIRANDIAKVKNKLASLTGERYIVVQGPKGVGKTCIVDTVLQRRPGVLRFNIPSGKSYEDIMNMVFSAVSGN